MNDADANDSSPSRLQATLLDYFSAPGKFQLSLREPALLFASIREILQLAAGRNATGKEGARVREAAVFFVRAALLYPGADHYALLGFAQRAEPVDVKERYRLLMRLIHPDFAAAGSVAWPADAAMRVNRAYEVLSSAVLRREYDDQLAANLRPQRPAAAPAAAPARASAAARAPAAVRRSREEATSARKKFGIAVAAGAALFAILLLLPHAEPDQLVQKLPAVRPHEVRVARAEPPPEAVAPPQPVALPAALVAAETSSAPVLRQEPVPAPAAPGPQAPLVAAAPVQQHAAQRPAVQPLPVPIAPAPVQPAPTARRPVAAVPPARAPAPAASHALPAPIAEALAALSLRHVVAPAPAPAPGPEPVALASPAPPPVAVVEALPAPPPAPASAALVTVAVARPASALAPAALSPAPTLADAQPLLTQLLQMLETGKGEELLRLLDAKARQAPSARSLSHDYDQMVHGGRPVHVTQVEFRGETRDGVLLVTGRMRVHAGEPTIGSYGQKFLVRAEFVSRGGKTMLTGLSGAPD